MEAKFQVGDFVRISKYKKTFEKGYTARRSKEVFEVKSVDDKQQPVMYELKDLLGEDIEGKFYNEELQKTSLKDFALIDKIIKTKQVKGEKHYLVKYDGYGDKFNEWLTEEQLHKLT